MLPTSILSVPVHPLSMDQCVALVTEWQAGEGQHTIVTPNAEIIVQAQRDPALLAALQSADLAPPDGAGVVWALRRTGAGQVSRVSGVDLMRALCAAGALAGWRVFLLGGSPGAADLVAERLRETFPGLPVVGAFAGDGGERGDEETISVIKRMAGSAGIDILFVAYGAPKQELWLKRNLSKLPNVKIGMVVGGGIDILAGRQSRAPLWMQRAGLEWLYRLLRQPWRWKRMLRLPVFIVQVLNANRI